MADPTTNCLFYGDNLEVMRKQIDDQSIDLVYLDPPFNSKREYNVIFKEGHGGESQAELSAFEDFWSWNDQVRVDHDYLIDTNTNGGRVPAPVSRLIAGLCEGIGRNDITAYLVEMAIRLLEIHRVIKPTGSMYLHCGPAVSHYVKVVCDHIFGPENFRREIAWRSGWVSGFKTAVNNWVRNHDVILYYVKDVDSSFTFNKELAYKPHPPGYSRRGESPEDASKGYSIEDVWGAPRGGFDQEEKDVWSPWIKSFSKEKTPYQTQKPLALLRRIIKVSSNKGDLILDPFCGCGTTVVAAAELDRRWIGIDITHLAIAEIKNRLKDILELVNIPTIGEPKDVESARQLALEDQPSGRYQFQWWVISLLNAVPTAGTKKKGSDKGIDGIIHFVDYTSEEKNATEQRSLIISVKSGGVSVRDVRELAGVLSRRTDSPLGLLVTLERPTRDMKNEAGATGFYKSPMWGRISKIQIVTVEQLLRGDRPRIPSRVRREEYRRGKAGPTGGGQSDIRLLF